MANLKDMLLMLKRVAYLSLIFSLIVIIPPSDSFPNGVGKEASSGCLCHGSNSDSTNLEALIKAPPVPKGLFSSTINNS